MTELCRCRAWLLEVFVMNAIFIHKETASSAHQTPERTRQRSRSGDAVTQGRVGLSLLSPPAEGVPSPGSSGV